MKDKRLRSAIWEHLKTKRKYNTLDIKYRTALYERDKLVETQAIKNGIFEIKEREWKKALEKQEQDKIEDKKQIAELKKQIKELKKNEKTNA